MDRRSRYSGCEKVGKYAAVSAFPQPGFQVLKILYQLVKVVRPNYRKILALLWTGSLSSIPNRLKLWGRSLEKQ
jgi:hypothetical protein